MKFVLSSFHPTAMFSSLFLAYVRAVSSSFPAGVIDTGGKPTLGTTVNQTSMARLRSVNLIDNFYIVAPPSLANISDAETCNADVAYLPGWYPTVVDGTTSFLNFEQDATSVYTGSYSTTTSYTVGDTVTPSVPYFTPSSSNSVTTSSISNDIDLTSLTTSGALSGATDTAVEWKICFLRRILEMTLFE
ncbi:hypothetical protein C8R44DRAFT_746729 [Mycena epipterygia]|nr:hypothetical protein C8R44DRAFT_746729 [Mycena epipterygia]